MEQQNDRASIEAQYERYCETAEFNEHGVMPFIKRLSGVLLDDAMLIQKPIHWDAWTLERQYGYNAALETIKQRRDYLKSRFDIP